MAREPRTVLFIDDETHCAAYYIESLRDSGFVVVSHDDAAAGLRYFNEHSDEIDILVLDIQMPTPANLPATATNDGLDTGIWVISQVRDSIKSLRVPIVVLSNRAKPALEDTIRDRIDGLPDGLVEITTKTQTSARQLPEVLDAVCQRWNR